MVGPPWEPPPARPGWRPHGSELSENLGLRRGLGRIFGFPEGVTVYAAAGAAFAPGGLSGGENWTSPRTREKEVGKERRESGAKHRRRAVESVVIADHAALCEVERRRNDPPPQGRCPSGGGRGGQPVRVVHAVHGRGTIHRLPFRARRRPARRAGCPVAQSCVRAV